MRKSAYLQEDSQKFWMVVNYVTTKNVEDLVKALKTGKSLSKESVIRECKFELGPVSNVADDIQCNEKLPIRISRPAHELCP